MTEAEEKEKHAKDRLAYQGAPGDHRYAAAVSAALYCHVLKP